MTSTGNHNGNLKLDIGCGRYKKEGFTGIDITNQPGVDIILNMERDKIPLEDQSVDFVYSSHFIEHVKSPVNFLKEVGRLCRHGAGVEIWAPWSFHNSAFFFSHERYKNEEEWKHMSILNRDGHLKVLGNVRWQLKQINYVIPGDVEDELTEKGFTLDFALWYFKNVATEMGLFFQISRDLDVEPVIPSITYSNHRLKPQYELKEYRKRFRRGIDHRLVVPDTLVKIYDSYPPFQAILFGTGELGEYIYPVLDKKRIQIKGYFDNNESKAGKELNGITIQQPIYIENMKVLIASCFDREISKQLVELGYDKKDIIPMV